MPMIAHVKFDKNCKVYSFDAGEETFAVGDVVVVETAKGLEMGQVVRENESVEEENCPKDLKKVVRKASYRDFESAKRAKESEPRSLQIARDKAVALGLDLKFISAEVSFVLSVSTAEQEAAVTANDKAIRADTIL